MLLSVTSRPGISTFGYNKNNKKVGKSAVLEFGYFLFWGPGAPLALTLSLRGSRLPLLSAALFFHLFFLVIFSYLVLEFQEFTVPYLRPESAVELKTNHALQVRSFLKLV